MWGSEFRSRNPADKGFGVEESGLELLAGSRLPQYRVGGVPGQDFPVHWEAAFRDGAVPDFVISVAFPLKIATMFAEDVLHSRSVADHLKGQNNTLFV